MESAQSHFNPSSTRCCAFGWASCSGWLQTHKVFIALQFLLKLQQQIALTSQDGFTPVITITMWTLKVLGSAIAGNQINEIKSENAVIIWTSLTTEKICVEYVINQYFYSEVLWCWVIRKQTRAHWGSHWPKGGLHFLSGLWLVPSTETH